MSKINHYQSFPHFVLRTPLLPYSFFKQLTSKQIINDDELKAVFEKSQIKEAIFLATPTLYYELEKWVDNKIKEPKKIEKLKFSLLKYISRMCSRPTPFGLFAGCSLGHFETKSKIILDKDLNNSRHTRLDMNYLVALSQNLAKDKNIKYQILFYPNTSLYKSGAEFRYVEYEYINSARQHHIIAVEGSKYLEKVLDKTKNGLLLNDIIDLLIDDENSENDVVEFVEELIDSQILTNELEPSVSGPEFLDHIIAVLSKIKNTENQVEILEFVSNKLLAVDETIGNNANIYIDISIELEKLKTDFDIKYLFQTDMILNPKSNQLDILVINSIKKGLSLFNKITIPQKNNLLSNFKEAFHDRFEEREVSLAIALDVELGVGYKQNQRSLDINPLIDDINIPYKEDFNSVKELKWSRFNSFFNRKLIESFSNDDYCIVLSDEDLVEFEEKWDDLPDTISAMIEIVVLKGEQKILISNAGGSSAANLLGRFCHGDSLLNEFTKSITKFEENANKDKIIAEIVHLPESRVGNILMRPIFRKFEIAYLARSVVDNNNQIKIDDLYVSVINNKIHLKSKIKSTEIIPRLSNAHNYTSNSLPIYNFLSDMQTQDKRPAIGIDLGPFVDEYSFFPRIEYNDLILSEAQWNFKKQDIEQFFKIYNETELIMELRNFRVNKKIPQNILLVDGDNELLVNLENLLSAQMFLSIVKNRVSFKIKEFLHSEDGIVKNSNSKEHYTNQMVMSFYNSKKENYE